jgi:hypothetical protein
MSTNLIMGESADDIRDALFGLNVEFRPDGRPTLRGTVPTGGPFIRALMRAEAELLAADAVAMQTGVHEACTPDQRRADAFRLLVHRVEEHARAA